MVESGQRLHLNSGIQQSVYWAEFKEDIFSLPRGTIMIRTVLLIVLVLLLLGALPAWPYSTGWGYYPSGGLGLVLLILVVLIVAKKI
jgi:hypothetical protein